MDFHRNWADYKNGFGKEEGEFWLGLEKLYEMTAAGPMRLRVEMVDRFGECTFAEYASFSVGNESSSYRLSLSGYANDSTASDAMLTKFYSYDTMMNGMEFSTTDRDNDKWTGSCANEYTGICLYSIHMYQL